MTNNKSVAVGFRIPNELYQRIEAYGRENNPREKSDYDKTATLLELIEKGLNPDNKEADSQVSEDERKRLRDGLFADMKEFLGYRLKAFKAELLDSVEQTVQQNNTASTQLLDNVKQDVKQIVRSAIFQEKESIEQVIEDDGTIRRISLEIENIYLQLKDLKEAVKPSSNGVEQFVKQKTKANNDTSNSVKQPVKHNSEIIVNLALKGFYNLSVQEKRKYLSMVTSNKPDFKERVRGVLKDRQKPPKRLICSYLNVKECDQLYSELTRQ